MAIYRPPKPRWRLVAAGVAAGLTGGLLLGAFVLGQKTPDPADAIRAVRSDLSAAAAALEVLEVEYGESVKDGRVVSEVEYRGARDVLARSRAHYLRSRAAVVAIDPAGAREVEKRFAELRSLVERHAPADDVAAGAGALTQLLIGVLGG